TVGHRGLHGMSLATDMLGSRNLGGWQRTSNRKRLDTLASALAERLPAGPVQWPTLLRLDRKLALLRIRCSRTLPQDRREERHRRRIRSTCRVRKRNCRTCAQKRRFRTI